MAKRTKNVWRYYPFVQVDRRFGGSSTYTTVQNAPRGWRQSIEQTGVFYFTDRMGRKHKLTAVEIRKTSLKSGRIRGWISQQYFDGYPVNNYSLSYGMRGEYSVFNQFPTPTTLTNATIIKAYAKLDRMEVGGGENLATIGQTFKMLRNPLSSVAKLTNEMMHTARRKTSFSKDLAKYYRNLADAASNQWLQYRYGIMPLVYDVAGAGTILENKLWAWENKVKTVRAVMRDEKFVPYNESQGVGYVSNIVARGMWQYRTKVAVLIFYQDKLHMADAITLEELGLSPTQLPALAWELIPFSFVVDWGLNVGDWLKAIAPKPTMDILGSCMSIKKNVDLKCTCQLTSFQAGSLLTSASFKGEELIRTLNPRLPTSPGMTGQALSIKRQIDSLALGWQMFPTKSIKSIVKWIFK